MDTPKTALTARATDGLWCADLWGRDAVTCLILQHQHHPHLQRDGVC